jgi:hypothetical protein
MLLLDQPSQLGPYALSLVLLLAYLLLVAVLRHQRERAMRQKLGYTTRESLRNMTNDDAFTIVTYLSQLEFPKLWRFSTEFALFKAGLLPLILPCLRSLSSFVFLSLIIFFSFWNGTITALVLLFAKEKD